MHPLITIIIPFFNAEKYLERCLQSVANQTYGNLQIIMVDDGSTDNSACIAKKYADSDARCVLLQQTNKGVSAARNLGMKHAQGEFVAFVDADDFLDADYYDNLIKYAEADIVQSGLKRISTDGKIKIEKSSSPYRFVTPWSKLIRRQFLVDNNIEFVEDERYEDVLFSLDMWMKTPKIVVADCIGYNYCANENAYTASSHDTTRLFYLLKQRLHENMPIKIRLVAIFTYLKLKFHFLLHLD